MDPWDTIPQAQSSSGFNKQRAKEGSHTHQFFRGKDSHGNYVFLYQGELSAGRLSLQGSRNITLDKQIISGKLSQLVFTLHDIELKSLFRHFCLDLISAANDNIGATDEGVADIILNRFKRWQNLLSGAKNNILKDNKILGLYGELRILREIFIPNCDIKNVIEAWCGPLGEEQDFAFNKKLLEVKSSVISKDSQISISSAEQLDDVSGEIFLCHQTFSKAANIKAQGETLNQIVASIQKLLSNKNVPTDAFEARLLAVGYVNRPEYDILEFSLAKVNFYHIAANFPRITATELMVGVLKVRYSIQLDHCVNFQISESTFLEGYFDGK